MLSAVDEVRAPSEHSGRVQNCNDDDDDDGCRRAVIESDCERSSHVAWSSCLLHALTNTCIIGKGQVQLMLCFVLNTQNLVVLRALRAFTGMNKPTYSACIGSLEIPYRVMFLHLISTSVRAVDDLQSS